MKISILVSGNGSNMEAIVKAVQNGYIEAQIGIVLSNRSGIKALTIAERLGVKNRYIAPDRFGSREDYDREIVSILNEKNTDLVCLAGYMRILSPYFIKSFVNRIINIHPSILPSFPGLNAQKQAIEYGCKISGATVHFVDEGVDTGPIIIQSAVPIEDDDNIETLSKKISAEEHRIYPLAVKTFVERRIDITNRQVTIKPER